MRELLLGVIERLLSEGLAFNDISIDVLVSEADIARSTFYVYFEDKGDLMRAWMSDAQAQAAKAAEGWWALDGDSTRDDLRAVQLRLLGAYRPHVTLLDACHDGAATDPELRAALEERLSADAAALRKHIRAGQKAGFVDPELSAPDVADVIARMFERGVQRLLKDVSDDKFQKLVGAYTDIIWNTLYAPTRR